MAKISVIVPVYKVESYIHRCVESILGQTFTDFELILVDDGSPDNCGKICDEYAKKDCRIHVIHQENGGLSAARNAGIDWAFTNSDSEWLAFIDSDDWVHKNYLEVLRDIAVKHQTKIAICDKESRDCWKEDVRLTDVNSYVTSAHQAYTEHYSMCISACCKLYHKSLWDGLRFPEGKQYEDAFVTHIPLFEAEKVAICEVPLYYYYCNPTSITRVKWTPRRLDRVEAHEKRMIHWKTLGEQECYICDLNVFIETLCSQILEIKKMNVDSLTKTCHLLRIKLRKALAEARTFDLYPFVEQYWGEYSIAYPGKIHRKLAFFWIKLTEGMLKKQYD